MKPVTVLADEILQNPPILQLHERHVRCGRYSLQRVGSLCARLALGSQRPVSIGAAKVGDSYCILEQLFSVEVCVELASRG